MLFFAVALAVVTPPSAPAPAPAPAPAAAPAVGPGFADDGQLGHYLQWYGADYLVMLGAGTLLATGALDNAESLPALIGPAVSLKSPDETLIFDPRLDDVIGRPILQEKVPTGALAIALGSAIVAVAGADFAVRQDLHRVHAVLVGGLEAVLGAALVTDAMKLTFGRLRPDFRERWLRAACSGVTQAPAELDCTGVDDAFVVDREFLLDGMRSFPSGHASTSFAAATFLALTLGGEHLWSSHAQEWARPFAGLALGGLLAGAGYISASRVSDNRHHLEDVVVGGAIGVASGTAAYLLHFDMDGRARRRGSHREKLGVTLTSLAPLAIEGGAGAVMLGRF